MYSFIEREAEYQERKEAGLAKDQELLELDALENEISEDLIKKAKEQTLSDRE